MTMILSGTNGGTFPSWTTAGRPATPAVGQFGYNTTTGLFDMYTASGWVSSLTSASQSVPKAALPTGSVLQVVSYSASLSTATTSGTYVTTGLAATITPTSATSKILVIASGAVISVGSGTVGYTTIYRNGSNLTGSNGMTTTYTSSGGNVWTPLGVTTFDSPASTSAQTYTLYIRVGGSGTAQFGDGGASQQTMTLLEIAA